MAYSGEYMDINSMHACLTVGDSGLGSQLHCNTDGSHLQQHNNSKLGLAHQQQHSTCNPLTAPPPTSSTASVLSGSSPCMSPVDTGLSLAAATAAIGGHHYDYDTCDTFPDFIDEGYSSAGEIHQPDKNANFFTTTCLIDQQCNQPFMQWNIMSGVSP